MNQPTSIPSDPQAAVAAVSLWYHTLELREGVVTPGWFDLRPIVDRLPWPDVRGLRCLDVGTFDGFFAFELERRGAASVVAVDIGSHEHWDWPHSMRTRGPDWMREQAGPAPGTGFRVAHELLGSLVEHRTVSVYDLDPAEIGRFDVVVCGSLLLHLRDPLRAIEAIRSVCAGHLLSSEEIDIRLTALAPRRPALRLDGVSTRFQWFVPNAAGHRRMLESVGFSIERWTRPYAIPFGAGYRSRGRRKQQLGQVIFNGLLTRGKGIPHQAVLARA